MSAKTATTAPAAAKPAAKPAPTQEKVSIIYNSNTTNTDTNSTNTINSNLINAQIQFSMRLSIYFIVTYQ